MLLARCGFWVIGWPQIVIVIIALAGAIGTAIWSYFFLHDDVRNVDHTCLSAREKWLHIAALLAFFLLGALVFGGGSVVIYRFVETF